MPAEGQVNYNREMIRPDIPSRTERGDRQLLGVQAVIELDGDQQAGDPRLHARNYIS
jgi:hypothetical protein